MHEQLAGRFVARWTAQRTEVMKTTKSTVFIVQDHPVDTVANLVRSMGCEVQVFRSARKFVDAATAKPRNACVIVDLEENPKFGLTIQQYALEARISLPFLFVVDPADTHFSVSAIRRGAITVLERPVSEGSLKSALDEALMSAEVYRAFAESGIHRQRLDSLSERERRIIQLAADGVPNKRIAGILGLSVKTVEKQRRQAYARLKVHSTAEMSRAVTLGRLHFILQNQKV